MKTQEVNYRELIPTSHGGRCIIIEAGIDRVLIDDLNTLHLVKTLSTIKHEPFYDIDGLKRELNRRYRNSITKERLLSVATGELLPDKSLFFELKCITFKGRKFGEDCGILCEFNEYLEALSKLYYTDFNPTDITYFDLKHVQAELNTLKETQYAKATNLQYILPAFIRNSLGVYFYNDEILSLWLSEAMRGTDINYMYTYHPYCLKLIDYILRLNGYSTFKCLTKD
jgi:hypothetical protein